MTERNPELAHRDDEKRWFVDSDLKVVKPGDIVLVTMVLGKRFGEFDEVEDLDKAATFLGEFSGDEEDTLVLAEYFIGPNELSRMSQEELDGLNKMPYFRANFDGLGDIVFAGSECFWSPNLEA